MLTVELFVYPKFSRAMIVPWIFIITVSTIWLCGCSNPQAAENHTDDPAAIIENSVKESELATVTLSLKAEERLGVNTEPVAIKSVAQTRTFAGEITLPPDRTISVTAPMSGTLAAVTPLSVGRLVRNGQAIYSLTPLLSPERDLRVQLERDATNAQTRVDAADIRLKRAEQLLRERAGSEKALEQAREELDLAENDLNASRERLDRYDKAPVSGDTPLTITAPQDGMIQKIFIGSSQTVSGGETLFEVVDLSSLWIRVPIYVGDLKSIDQRQTACVHGLNEAPGAGARSARPVNAPPTANPLNDTVDLYFELANTDGSLRPGQKTGVTLSENATEESLVVPWAAVLHDIHGNAWVYEKTGLQQYVRRRVEVRRVIDSLAVIERGPAVGTNIVTAGVVEIFGAEFSTGK